MEVSIMTGQIKGLEHFRVPQRRSKVTVERVALVVLSVLLLAAVIALARVRLVGGVQCSCEDRIRATQEATTASVNNTTQTEETATTIAPPVSTFSSNVAQCDDNWVLHGTKCYYFSPRSVKLPWKESRAMCQRLNGDLVKIESRGEQQFLDAKLQRLMFDHWDKFWIGLTDSESEGHWVWTDGSALNTSVVFWAHDEHNKEPDNWTEEDPEGEDCVRMGLKPSMGNLKGWYDRSCKKKHRSICEKNSALF